MNARLHERVRRAIVDKVFPGSVIGLLQPDGTREVLPFGHLRYDEKEPVTENTVYDLASITKSIPLASLTLELVAEKLFSLGDTVKMLLPELQRDFGATIEDLMRYRVHGAALSSLAHLSADELKARVLESGFDGPPGESHYSNLPALLLGFAVERATGEQLEALAQKRLFGPLGMRSTLFPVSERYIDTSIHSRIAPTEVLDGTELRGIVHDESARVFAREGRAVGHAGLFSTAGDLLNFIAPLISEGNQISLIREGAVAGLGWSVNVPHFMGTYAGPTTFGKTGFTGTSVVADAERGIGLVILSNRTYPKRPSEDAAIYRFRRDVADIVFA